jgi:1-acyl-sn-glycerol-3-phosphate acyltransferase
MAPSSADQGETGATSPMMLQRALERLWGIIATGLAVLCTAILIWPAMLVSLFANGHLCTPIFRMWARVILFTLDISAEIVGAENLQDVPSFVLVSNHQSLLDILAVLLLIPREMRFLAKREIMQVPLIGFALEHSENIVIDRASGGRAIRRALTVVDHGYSICVFAEGRRFNDNRVHEFNQGAAWLAIATSRPCIPMAIIGTGELMPRGARFAWPRRRIRLVLRPPISTLGLRGADRTGLTERLQAEVEAAFRSEAALTANVGRK